MSFPPDDPNRIPDENVPEPNTPALPSIKPWSDLKSTLTTMLMAYNTATHLVAEQKYNLGYRIVNLGLYLLRWRIKDDVELKQRLEEIRQELKDIPPPHLSVTAGLQEDMPVEIIGTARPTEGVNKPLVTHAITIHDKIMAQEYAEREKKLDSLVQEITVILAAYKLISYDEEEDDEEENPDFDEDEESEDDEAELYEEEEEPEPDENEGEREDDDQ